MSRKKISFSDIFMKFKKKVGVEKDYKVAELLDFKQSTFSQRKKDGSIPYEELILYCRTHAVSLDELFNVKKTEALDYLSDEEKRYASMTIKALRNTKTASAIKVNLDVLSAVPGDKVEQPMATIKCIVCHKEIANGDFADHQLKSPDCNLRNENQILRLEKEPRQKKTLQLVEEKIRTEINN